MNTQHRGRRAHAGPPADERPARPALTRSVTEIPFPPPHPRTGTRLRLRPRSVRAKIVSVLMVPVVSLMALWAFAAVTTAQDISGQLLQHRIDDTIREPVAATVTALQTERRAAAGYLASPTAARARDLERREGATDRAAAPLRLDAGHTVADGTGLPDAASRRVRTFVDSVKALRELRPRITARTAGWDTAYDAYGEAVENAFAVGGALAGTPGDRVVLELGRAGELLAREDAMASAAQLTRSLSGGRYRDFTGAVQGRRLLLRASVEDLSRDGRARWGTLMRSGPYTALQILEDRVLAAGPGRAAAAAAPAVVWEQAAGPVLDRLNAIERQTGPSARHTDPVTGGILTRSGAAVLLGLLAVLASLLISVRIGRGLVVELVELRNAALELARRKLPRAMRRLRAGEEIDIEAEVPHTDHGGDEIGQVGEALGTLQRAALQAAVERAELLSGVSGVFVNLARRSQVLVHRQLALLDTMERRTEDPNELEDLFRLDHLTTRMRRHAEGLIILSGAAPGRAWRRPVPLTNVVRAAVGEVEDYARIEVRRLPPAAVVGGAVADLTHLIAELVENAAQFSPPHTKVRVYGEQVGNGYAIEVEDRGLGMGKEAMAEANRRIEQAQALDLFDSDRLGLFVVSRLARRQGVKVSLRPSPYGGTTAVVLLPTALLELNAPEADATRPATAKGRPAGPVPDGSLPARTRVPLPAAHEPPPPGPDPAAHRGGIPRVLPEPGPAPGPAPDTGARPGSDGPGRTPPPGDSRLPRRVRRASLAPQLLEAPAPKGRPGTPPDAPPAPVRSPEDIRATMTAYRSGWVRGGGPDARDTGPARRPLRTAAHPAEAAGRHQDTDHTPDGLSPEGDHG
jgi:signal transduction histidine kinase